jgi:RHS repeat-associated protein
MAYDRMGRRVEISRFKEQSLVLKQVFLYDGYQQIGRKIQDYESLNLVKEEQFIWDPTEPVATRPLVWNRSDATSYYIFDGKKNVSEVVSEGGDIVAHYEYAPFGTLSSASGDSAYLNPWRFSSEYADDGTATVYYNYRNYEPICGRWMGKDPLDEQWSVNLYSFCQNNAEYYLDAYGLWSVDFSWTFKDIPLPLPFAPNWYLVIGNKISGQMGSCCSCTKGRTIYLQAKWTPSLAVRYGYKDKLGFGKDGRLLRKDKNGRWHNFDNNQFSRQPVQSVSDMYDELVDAVLGKGRISFEADEEKEKCCPKEGVSGELRGFLRGQISAWGYGSAFDITWVIYPNGSWSPKTDDARFGRVGRGTQFYADAGIEGDVKLSHVVE